MPREVHGFVLRKPSEIRTDLVASGFVDQATFETPEPVSEADLAFVHYTALIRGLHEPKAVARAIEFPELALMPAELVWQAVVQPQLLAAGGTCAALRAAAAGDWAINLSGGYHHARRNLSHGFCLINDVALAVDSLRREGVRKRILIFDLDLHQGDGNASFFANDLEVFTVSVHEEGIFPIPKLRSDIDVGLRSWAADDEYLGAVEEAMKSAADRFDPEIIVYVAGADPYEDDPLGSLRVSVNAMRTRDERVARFARDRGCALVVLPAGGYSNESPSITATGFRAIAQTGGT
jgi:acetoin utilization deacetylase AcuC-like enzyme